MLDLNSGKGIKMSFDMRGTTEKPTVEGQLFSFEELSKDSEDMVQESTEAGTEVCGNEKGSELGIEADEDVPLKLEKELVCLKDKTQKQDQVIDALMSTVVSLRDRQLCKGALKLLFLNHWVPQ